MASSTLPPSAIASDPFMKRLSKVRFITICLIASAIIAWSIGQIVGVILFGINLLIILGVFLVIKHIQRQPERKSILIPLAIMSIVGIMVANRLNLPSRLIRSFFANAFNLYLYTPIGNFEWVGLSYLGFRLIHALVESRRLKPVTMSALTTYSLLPLTFIAGPIDRFNHFAPQVENIRVGGTATQRIVGLRRIGFGLVKKLVLSNLFSLFALTPSIIVNPDATQLMLCVSLLAYAFMLYFDFAGYSDIAIGAARLLGIELPENFENPYAQPSITRFWQCWHITLSSWLRDYLFFPISRTLLRRFGNKYSIVIMAVAHLTTMTLAGLWHGFTTGFVVWGLWHGTGLFLHAQWSIIARRRGWSFSPYLGTAMTFVFVVLGWSFFALPNAQDGLLLLVRLFKG